MASKLKASIFTPNDPTAPRVCPALACEIGLNESMLLLQLEFWIRLSGKLQEDGRFWIYESLTDFQEIFPFWSTATINRAVHSLQKQELIYVGNYNKLKFDRTRWFALNGKGLAKLKSVHVVTDWALGDDTSISQNDTRTDQNDTSSAQNDTTIPDLSPDLSPDFSTPSSGEKLPESEDELFEPAQEIPPKTAEQYRKELQSVAGADPLSGMLKARETASAKSWTVPGVAGGADDWERVADAFCCLQGIRVSDMPPKKQTQWARKLQAIGEEAQATPGQVIAAIRILPDTELAFKVPGYTTPFKQAFEDDIAMTIAKMATGQLGGTVPSSCEALAKAGYDVEALKRYAQERAAN